MPYPTKIKASRRKSKTYPKRKYTTKRRVGYVVPVNRGVRTGFPLKMKIAHKYVETLSLISTSGALSQYNFSANGMYDPNLTGVGHQPLYFDQMTALYNHYTVIGSKIKVNIVPTASGQSPSTFAVYLNDDASNVTNMGTVREYNNAKFITFPADCNENKYVSSRWSMKKAFGKGGSLANSLMRGSISSNPQEYQAYTLSFQSVDLASTTSVYITVVIEYIAIWNELRDVSSS